MGLLQFASLFLALSAFHPASPMLRLGGSPLPHLSSPLTLAAAQSPDQAITLPSHAIHHAAVPWIRCDVCTQMVANGYDITLRRREEGVRDPKQLGGEAAPASKAKAKGSGKGAYIAPPREEEVMESLETLCNPFSENGWWIRYWGIAVSADRTTAALEPLEDYMQCKGHCLTIAEACQRVFDSPALDRFSGQLYKWRRSKEDMQSSLCRSECAARDALVAEVAAGLAAEEEALRTKAHTLAEDGASSGTGDGTKSGSAKVATKTAKKSKPKKKKTKSRSNKQQGSVVERLPKAIAAERHEPADDKQMDVEEMIDRMERQRDGSGKSPKMDVYSRDTITEMQAAMTHGTKAQAAMFDPHVSDLTDEEFAALQRMFKDEKGEEYPVAPDFEAAAVARGERPGSDLGRSPPSAAAVGEATASNAATPKDAGVREGAGKKGGAASRVTAAEEALRAQIDRLSDEEVLALVERLERSEGAGGGDEGILDMLGLGAEGGAAGKARKGATKKVPSADYFRHDYDGEEQPFEGFGADL